MNQECTTAIADTGRSRRILERFADRLLIVADVIESGRVATVRLSAAANEMAAGRVQVGPLVITTQRERRSTQWNAFELGRDLGEIEVRQRFGLPPLEPSRRRLSSV